LSIKYNAKFISILKCLKMGLLATPVSDALSKGKATKSSWREYGFGFFLLRRMQVMHPKR
jgi:hypothetical protein